MKKEKGRTGDTLRARYKGEQGRGEKKMKKEKGRTGNTLRARYKGEQGGGVRKKEDRQGNNYLYYEKWNISLGKLSEKKGSR